MRITILAENYAYKTAHSEWGFAALIEIDQKKFLFDVGLSGTCLLDNAKELELSISQIDGVILSHGHYDHTDGLEPVLNRLKIKHLYGHPDIFSHRYSLKNGELAYKGMRLTRLELEEKFGVTLHLESGVSNISEHLFLTGTVPFTNSYELISPHFKVCDPQGKIIGDDSFPDDNSLVLDTPKGLVIVFGCAHRGIVNIMEYVKKTFNKKIYGIIGGTHLYIASPEHFAFVVEYMKKEEIELIAPGHCTGMQRIFDLQNIFKDKVRPAFCGERFTF